MKKKLLIIILAVVVIAGGAAYYFLAIQGGEQEEAETLYSYVPGDYFVTNVKDSNKLFKVTVVLMLNTDKLQEDLAANEYIIRDTIIHQLRELTEEDIVSEDIQDRLRANLKEQLNLKLQIDNIVTIYFNDFVMQ